MKGIHSLKLIILNNPNYLNKKWNWNVKQQTQRLILKNPPFDSRSNGIARIIRCGSISCASWSPRVCWRWWSYCYCKVLGYSLRFITRSYYNIISSYGWACRCSINTQIVHNCEKIAHQKSVTFIEMELSISIPSARQFENIVWNDITNEIDSFSVRTESEIILSNSKIQFLAEVSVEVIEVEFPASFDKVVSPSIIIVPLRITSGSATFNIIE